MAYDNLESPIERKFRLCYNDWKNGELKQCKLLGADNIFNLEQQKEIYSHKRNKYVVDFYEPTTKICIELDGYEFHKTKSQFIADRKKDRDLFLSGYYVIRFAGAECTDENIVSVLEDVYNAYCHITLKNSKGIEIGREGEIF